MPLFPFARMQRRPATAPVVAALLGFTAVAGQIVLLREIIVLFSGNEISMGIALTAWLVWTAAGSSFAGRMTRGRMHPRDAVAVLECLTGGSLAPTIWMLRAGRAMFQTVPGELIGPLPMLLAALVGLSVFCMLSGSLFVMAARLYQQECMTSERLATSYAYLLEAIGSGVGGILTSVLLLRYFGSFQIAMIVAVLNIGVAVSVFFHFRRGKASAIGLACVAFAIPLVAYVAPLMDRSAEQRMWQGFQVVESRSTIYGTWTVVGTGELRTIYGNGLKIASIPDEAAAEEAVHYALLEHPAPVRVLLIGGGANGSIAQGLQHPTVRRIDYVELDPALVEMARHLSFGEAARSFSDPRVRVHFADGRLWLKSTAEKFDVIVLDLPDPQTAQLNRFYTEEFFRSAQEHLEPGGLVGFEVESSEETISPELGEYLRCIRRTVGEVFPFVAVIPGEITHFFAATRADVLTEDPQVLIARLRSRGLHTRYVREYFIPFRMMPDRMAQIHALLRVSAGVPINRDFRPTAYYFDTVLWGAQFHVGWVRGFENAAHLPFEALLGGVAVFALLGWVLWVQVPGPDVKARLAALGCVASGGFTLMALEILLLFSFQAVYGYVYHELAILIGMFLAGIGLGSWLGIRRVGLVGPALAVRAMARNQMMLASTPPALLLVASLLSQHTGAQSALWTTQLMYPALALLCGIPGGYQFPLATEICLRSDGAHPRTGRIYALDLLGGSVGALLLSGYLIPVFGFWNSAWFTAAVSLAPGLMSASIDAHQRRPQ